MSLDLAAVAREATARWRQDRAILMPLAGLFLFVPQWAMLLLVPDPPAMPTTADPAHVAAWAEAVRQWVGGHGAICLGAFLIGQLGQLAIVALYVGPDDRSTVASALTRSAGRLPRFLLAGLLVAMPSLMAGMVATGAPALLVVAIPLVVYVLGRTMLIGPALLGRHGVGAARAVALSWRWTHGAGFPLAMLVGGAFLAMSIAIQLTDAAVLGLRHVQAANPVVVAAIDAGAAAVVGAAMLAVAMMQGVLYRRLAR